MTRRNKAVVLMAPCAPGKADDYLFEPDAKELRFLANEKTINEKRRQNRLAKLRKIDARFEADHREYLLAKCAALQAIVDADRKCLAAQDEAEKERKRIRDWWEQEHQREEQAADKARRERARKQLAQINADSIRLERKEMLRRNVVRGRKGR